MKKKTGESRLRKYGTPVTLPISVIGGASRRADEIRSTILAGAGDETFIRASPFPRVPVSGTGEI